MDLRHSSGPGLLPQAGDPRFPELSALPPRAAERLVGELQRAPELLSNVEGAYRSLYWSLRLLIAANDAAPWRHVRGFRFAAAGFFDPDLPWEGDRFGLILYASNVFPTFVSPSLSDFDLPSVEVNDYTFPVVVRRGFEYEAGPAPDVQPYRGTASCWAKSRCSRAPIGPGILTAKHVVQGLTISSPVRLTTGGNGTLLDIGPDGIDAAIIDTGEAAPTSQIQTSLVAPWADVEFTGATLHRTKVTAVGDQAGVFSSSLLPVRVLLNDWGGHGDSGALVTDAHTGNAVGIYTGEFTDLAGRTGGVAQHAFQAVSIMDMELYG